MKSFCVETQRCVGIFEDDQGHEGSSNRGPILTVDEGLGSLKENFDVFLKKNGDTNTRGDGQGRSTTSTRVPTSCRPRSGTLSRGAQFNRSIDSGVGGSEPPEDGKGGPPIPGHYRDYEGGDEEETNRDEEAWQTAGGDAGVNCSNCNGRPKTIQVCFTAEGSFPVLIAIAVYCSEACAQTERTGSESVISVTLWDTESSSIRLCPICYEFKSMPITICWNCRAYMCGTCSRDSKKVNSKFKCPYQCPEDSSIVRVLLPACIAEAAQLVTIDLDEVVPGDQFNEERERYFEHTNYVSLPPMFDESAVDGVIQRMPPEQQFMRHRRAQLDDENRRLDEANFFQSLFSTENTHVESSTILISPDPLDDSDHGTPSEPPSIDYQPPSREVEVEQEIEDPGVEEEQEDNQPQELVPTLAPAPKESDEEEDEDEGVLGLK
ncbi:uncharacterized protein LOC117307034 isoform X2 [Asterias rubens]|uniref:uncharacterized protein LOC117307034 isoform X2 n=1 Tax=Asterias rubens TaxID=7604 RepID=UPI0014555CBB|nr:uncharacterized protein LOC117307034 isoform X2 [Asterias rubens]